MSQRRQKKQLSTLDNVGSLTDHELREALKGYNQAPGPITDSTRALYQKKLVSLIEESSSSGDNLPIKQPTPRKETISLLDALNDADDDTSDEDYNAQDEEEDSSGDDDDSESSNDDEVEDEFDGELRDDIKLSSTTTDSDNLTTSIIVAPDAVPNRISRGILIFLFSFFVAILSFYLFSSSNYKSFLTLQQPYKHITKQLLILLALSPIGYAAYRTICFYRRRRHQEMQRVCDLVSEALELLQSPDNPTGLMPILHIRDTLLTPAERKTKKMNNLWSKAEKFIENHESRVKVELINIDGEDFRAWKWIGSKKTFK